MSVRALAVLLLLTPLVGGCLTRKAPERGTFVLAASRPAAPDEVGKGVLRVERIVVASIYERKGFVYQTGDTTYESDFYNEFFAPPGVLVRQQVMEWLDESNVFEAVVGGRAYVDADWLLEGRVNKLYGDLRDGEALGIVEVEFAIFDSRSARLDLHFQKRYGATETAENRSPAALATAWSRALSRILTEFEDDLRRSLGRPGQSRSDASRPVGAQASP